MNIILIGFMGSGKSTIGRKLAKFLEYTFIDTDYEIEDDQGCSIEEIFKYGGEECFRDMETHLLQKIKNVTKSVIATGGGIILREKNQEILKMIGKQVYLKVPREILLQRLQNDRNRPLLRDNNPEIILKKMFDERCFLYEQADFIIETGKISPKETALQIIQVLSHEDKK
tara:strand:- start:17 stop:529 length:513 start_codon:yes stop_codon:yes gene_type:complete